MKNPTISVIVPVYNTEKYLPRCIDSILAQTFTDFELLLIDDGSKDNSANICDEYAAKDQRVRVFHKQNGGVSSARNLGLDNAQGEWITFVDSDDWIECEYFSILASSSESDIIISYYVAEGWNGWVSNPFKDEIFKEENIRLFLNKYLISCNVPWAKLIKRCIIEKCKIRFDTNISYGEDTLFIMDCLRYVKSIEINSSSKYHYDCTNNTSLSKEIKDIDFYLTLIDTISYRIRILSSLYNADRNAITMSIIRMHSNYIFNILDYKSDKIKNNIYKICCNENVRNVLKDKKIKKTFKRKIFDWLLLHKYYNFIILLMNLKKL